MGDRAGAESMVEDEVPPPSTAQLEAPDAGSLPLGVATRFRVTGVIGRGGLATVYAAIDTTLDREVAVKVFSASATTNRAIRVQEAEAKLVASLNHYALTTLYDVGFDSTDPDAPQIYLVMERIPGEDLRTRLRRGPLTPEQVAYLGFDLAEGLAYVHEHGVLHRDLKPANVLLADREASTRLRGKLTDFGVATLIGVADESEYVTGTASYLSPEVVEDGQATPASDVYSLGLVLLEALTARQEYSGEVVEAAVARLDHDPAVPSSVPEPIAGLLREMTARDPAERPNLREVADRFQATTVDALVDARVLSPELPPRAEAARLAAVRRYAILDTPPDDAFDRIVALACRLLAAPIGLVAIIDADRVWMKSRRGIDLVEIARTGAIGPVLEQREPWSARDVQSDPRTGAIEYVVEHPELVACAVAPMVSAEGHVVGHLVVFDRQPRDFDGEHLAGLADLAAVAVRELDLRAASRRALFDR